MQNSEVVSQYQCDLTSLDAVQRKRRAQLASEVFSQILETRELATGYEFRFDFKPSVFGNLTELATLEHLCCPFFEITVKIDKNNGPLLLQITGDPGIKQFLQAEMNL